MRYLRISASAIGGARVLPAAHTEKTELTVGGAVCAVFSFVPIRGGRVPPVSFRWSGEQEACAYDTILFQIKRNTCQYRDVLINDSESKIQKEKKKVSDRR